MNPVDVHRAEPPGILIRRVRGYNLVVATLFGGRRGAVNRALAAASGAQAGDRVLDVGCGPGRFARVLADVVGPHGQIVGVDPSAPMIAYAARHAGRQSNCRFQLAAAQALDLPDASFDVVTSTFAMHHIPAQQRQMAIAHMFRVLRPGGRLLIADRARVETGLAHHRNLHPTRRLVPAIIETLSRISPRHASHPFDDLDVRHYAPALRHAGFTDVQFTTVKPWTGYLTAAKPAA